VNPAPAWKVAAKLFKNASDTGLKVIRNSHGNPEWRTPVKSKLGKAMANTSGMDRIRSPRLQRCRKWN
jgi:hypothetical protein